MAASSSSSAAASSSPAADATICDLLRALQAQKADVRQAAEMQLKEGLAHRVDETVAGLAWVLTVGDVPSELRQGAAVILRRCVVGTEHETEMTGTMDIPLVWRRLRRDTKAFIRSQLLAAVEAQGLCGGTSSAVAKSIAACIVAVVEEECDEFDEVVQEWPELLASLSRYVGLTSVFHVRVVGLGILKDLADTIGEDLLQHSQAETQSLLHAAVHDPHLEVQAAGAQLLLQLVIEVSSGSVALLAPLLLAVPAVMQALAGVAVYRSQMQETMESLIAALEDRPEVFRGPCLEKLWATLMHLCRREVQELHGDSDLRHSAMEAALTLLLAAPQDFCLPEGQPLLKQFVSVNMEWMLELEEDVEHWTSQADSPDGDDVDGDTLDMAEENFDRLGAAFQKKRRLEEVLLPIIFKELRMISERGAAQTWAQIRGAIVAVSQVAEYIEEETWIDHCVRFVGQYVGHPHPRVRFAAFQAIGQIAGDHEPYVQEQHHEFLLDVILVGLDDANIRVKAAAASAFASVAEECDSQDVAPHMDAFVTKLVTSLNEGATRDLQEQCLSALAVAAQLMEEKFSPCYPHLMPILKNIIATSTMANTMVLRGKAIECATLIGDAVGKEVFHSDAEELMHVMLEKYAAGFHPEDRSREYVQDAIGRVASTIGKDFKMYVAPLLHCLENVLHRYEEEIAVHANGINTSALSEVKDAMGLLGQVIEALAEDFCDFLQMLCRMLLPLTRCQVAADVQGKAFGALETATTCARKAVDLGRMPFEALKEFVKSILAGTIMSMSRTPEQLDSEALAILQAQGTGVSGVVRNAGKGVLGADEVLELSQLVLLLLGRLGIAVEDSGLKAKQHRRRKLQTEDDADLGELKDEEEGPSQETVRFCLADVLGSIMVVNPEDVARLVLPQLSGSLQHLLRKEGSAAEKGLALYVADDIVDTLGELSIPQWNSFMESAVVAICHSAPAVRQYAASTAGHAAQHQAFAQIAPLAARNLASVLLKHGERHRKSRAVSSEAKLSALSVDACTRALGQVCEAQEAALGQDVAQAWQLWLGSLPLRYDEDEGQKAHAQLLELVSKGNHAVTCTSALPQVLRILSDVYKTHFSNAYLDADIVANFCQADSQALERMVLELPKRLQKKAAQILKDGGRM